MSEATILKLADYVVGGVMSVAFFGFLSFVFWLRHVSDTRTRMDTQRDEWKREHGFDCKRPKGK
jgi:uncharacterized protein (DUF2062 family)